MAADSGQAGEGSDKVKPADLLTWYRIAAAPFILVAALLGWRDAFYILLILSLLSDLADGPVARGLGHVSARGAKLDTWADGLTVVVGLVGIVGFEGEALRPQMGWLVIFALTYLAAALTCLLKFGKLPAYHLYLSKLGALLSGVFVVWLYALGFSPVLLTITAGTGILANLESVLVTLRLKSFRTNLGSVLLVKRMEKGD